MPCVKPIEMPAPKKPRGRLMKRTKMCWRTVSSFACELVSHPRLSTASIGTAFCSVLEQDHSDEGRRHRSYGPSSWSRLGILRSGLRSQAWRSSSQTCNHCPEMPGARLGVTHLHLDSADIKARFGWTHYPRSGVDALRNFISRWSRCENWCLRHRHELHHDFLTRFQHSAASKLHSGEKERSRAKRLVKLRVECCGLW